MGQPACLFQVDKCFFKAGLPSQKNAIIIDRVSQWPGLESKGCQKSCFRLDRIVLLIKGTAQKTPHMRPGQGRCRCLLTGIDGSRLLKTNQICAPGRGQFCYSRAQLPGSLKVILRPLRVPILNRQMHCRKMNEAFPGGYLQRPLQKPPGIFPVPCLGHEASFSPVRASRMLTGPCSPNVISLPFPSRSTAHLVSREALQVLG